jgi:hypothetical protein
MHASRFPAPERRQLLGEPGIGPGVVERLERAGIHSLAQLRRMGVARAVAAICASMGSGAWANRHRPLERVCAREFASSQGDHS